MAAKVEGSYLCSKDQEDLTSQVLALIAGMSTPWEVVVKCSRGHETTFKSKEPPPDIKVKHAAKVPYASVKHAVRLPSAKK